MVSKTKREWAKSNRNNLTQAEEKLYHALCRKQVAGLKFRRQAPLYGYIVDFYSIEAALVVEVDGPYHETPEQQEYDRVRNMVMSGSGWTVLRFKNKDVENNLADVVEIIRETAEDILENKTMDDKTKIRVWRERHGW